MMWVNRSRIRGNAFEPMPPTLHLKMVHEYRIQVSYPS